MAKRPVAHADDDDDDDGIAITSPAKKARHVRIDSDDVQAVDVSDSDAGDSLVGGDDSDGVEPMDDDDGGASEERLRAEIQSQAKAKDMGEVAEMGVITKVELINFMCHDHLTVNLGPQINFLTGHNGSGKSAVLTAITVALGAKAAVTGRGAGIKAFIKNGKDVSQVTVTLKNKGDEAFNPAVYGDHIVVQRTIYRDGSASAGYRIKSGKTDKVVSSKREELDRILDHMNIQVDNPINVLSQDAARAFLVKSNAKSKYDFFLQGTQLAQLSEEYELVKQQIATIDHSLQQKETVLPEMKDAIRRAKAKMDEITAVERAEERLLEYEREMAWCMVVMKEGECADKAREVGGSEERLNKARAYVKEGTAKQEGLEEKIAEVEALAADHQASAGPTAELRRESEAALKAFKGEYRTRENDRRELEASILQDRREIQALERAVADEQAKLNIDSSEEKARKLAVIADLEINIEKIRNQFPRLQQELAAANDERARVEDEARRAEEHVEQTQHELQNLAGALARVQQAQGGGALAPYGTNLEALRQEIGRRQWVGARPLGPLGLHVKLKDASWSSVVHGNIGKTLSAFAVTSGEDVRTLREVFMLCQRRNRTTFYTPNPDIIVYRPDPSKGVEIERADLANKGYKTIMSLLEFSDLNVRDILVDRAFIERSPITRTRAEASELVRRMGEGVNVFSQEPPFKTFLRGQTESMLHVERWNKPQLFIEDRSAEISEMQQQLAGAEQRWREAKQARDELQTHLQQVNQTIRGIQTDKILRLQNALKQRERKLVDAIEANREEAPPNIAAMEERLEAKRAELSTAEGQHADMQADLARFQADNRPLNDEVVRLRAELDEHGATLRQYTAEIGTLQKKLTKARSDKAHYAKKQAEEEGHLEALQNELAELENTVRAWTEEVMMVHPERVNVPAGHDDAYLLRQIEAQKKIIDRRERSAGGTMEEAQGAYDRCKKGYDSAKREVAEMRSLLRALNTALMLRSNRWHTFRRFIALRANIVFQEHLDVRGFLGKLLFDHEKGTLNLRIQTDDLAQTQTQSSREKDPKQLSGGEKSFSTCALLLSLWDAVGCPIRCLDEFDVFMDAVVRRQTLNMMMEVAQKSDGTQYVLITPQDMSGVRTGPAVRIHKMRDPERLDNQSRLNFAAV